MRVGEGGEERRRDTECREKGGKGMGWLALYVERGEDVLRKRKGNIYRVRGWGMVSEG